MRDKCFTIPPGNFAEEQKCIIFSLRVNALRVHSLAAYFKGRLNLSCVESDAFALDYTHEEFDAKFELALRV